MDRAEFSFDFGEGASTIYHALLPETREAFPRSRAALSVDGGMLHLIVDAEDIAAMRAALNTWLRLIKVACEMAEIRHGREISDLSPRSAKQRRRPSAEDRFKNSVLSVFSVVKSGDFYRLCGIDLTTTEKATLSEIRTVDEEDEDGFNESLPRS